MTAGEFNVISLEKKSGHRYVYCYDDESYHPLIQQLFVCTLDPTLDLTLADAGCLARMATEKREKDGIAGTSD